MNDTLLLLAPELNKTYTEIINSEISVPPYYQGKVQHTFFLKKRKGLHVYKDFGGDEVLDYIYFEGNDYALVKGGSTVYLRKNNSTTTLWSNTYDSNTTYKFSTMKSASGAILDSGTGANGTIVGSDTLLEDTTKSWTVDEYAGNYVYITGTGVGAGRISQIGGNTATGLRIDGWYNQPDTVSYTIFDDYDTVLCFTGGDGLYVMHNEAAAGIIKADKLGSIIDFIIINNRLVYLLDDGHLWESSGGYFMFQTVETKYIGKVQDALTLFQYHDFIIVGSKNDITIIKSQNTNVTEFYVDAGEVLTKQTTIESYTISQTIYTLGLFSKTSYVIYNTGVYLFTANKKFVALNISGVTDTQYQISQDDQGGLIQKYLDNITDDDIVSLSITEESIKIGHYNGNDSKIYIFDLLYKFWHHRTTDLKITNIKKYIKQYYIGEKIYQYDDSTLADDLRSKDVSSYSYSQEVTAILGEPEIMNIKRYLMAKFLIGSNTDTETVINFLSRFNGREYIVSKTLNDIIYLKHTAISTSIGELGENVMGFGLLGGPLGDEELRYGEAEISLIEIPLGQTANMFKINIVGDIEFGGMLVSNDVLESHLTELSGVA